MYALGTLQIAVPVRPVLELLQQHFNYPIESIRTFYRLLVGDDIFFAKSINVWQKGTVILCCIKKDGKFSYGIIVQFYLFQKNAATALIETVRIVSVRPFAEGDIEIVQVSKLEKSFIIIDIHSLREKCVCVGLQHVMYVCRFPSKILCD